MKKTNNDYYKDDVNKRLNKYDYDNLRLDDKETASKNNKEIIRKELLKIIGQKHSLKISDKYIGFDKYGPVLGKEIKSYLYQNKINEIEVEKKLRVACKGKLNLPNN